MFPYKRQNVESLSLEQRSTIIDDLNKTFSRESKDFFKENRGLDILPREFDEDTVVENAWVITWLKMVQERGETDPEEVIILKHYHKHATVEAQRMPELKE